MIIHNRIKCKSCGGIIESKYRNDFVTCKCGKVSVDGGHAYLGRTFNADKPEKAFEDLSECTEEEKKMDTQEKIKEIYEGMTELQLEKNKRYGDAALKPNHIFYKGSAQDSILLRLDDKLSRIMNNNGEPRANDIADVIGYCTLLLISKGVTKEELIKMID